MIDVDKIKGKNVRYTGEYSELLTNGSFYSIGFDENSGLFTVDDVGKQHWLSDDWLADNFDVSEFIKKEDVVGKYVRYIAEGSFYMRKGDIGIIRLVDSDGDYWVHWLNPNIREVDDRGWCATRDKVEFV